MTYLIIALGIILASAAVRAVYTYGYAIFKNTVTNPPTIIWHDEHPDEELYRNYFFGPWRLQIKKIYLECRRTLEEEPNFFGFSKAQEWLGEIPIGNIPAIIKFFLLIPVFSIWFVFWLFHFAEIFFGFVFTTLLLFSGTVIQSLVVFVVQLFAKITAFCIFSYEARSKSINKRTIRCTYCYEESDDPHFRCPQCQKVHTILHPNRFGIWNTICECGYKLPMTHRGRQRTPDVHEVCPFCGNEMLYAMSKNFGIQLVGGTSVGKTSFMSAFWHVYLKKLENHAYNELQFHKIPEEYFDDLEYHFRAGTSDSTSDMTAISYTVAHNLPDSDTMLNLSIYDIAGEAFIANQYEKTQTQFTYCEGLIIMVDPLSSPDFRSSDEISDEEMMGYSHNQPYTILSAFLETYKNLNRYRKKLINVPVSVVITKTDISAINRRISIAHLTELFEKNSYAYGNSFTNARDDICKEFLYDTDFGDFLQLVDANFKNVHYYPISAIGHILNGQPYRPDGVFEAVSWLLSDELKRLLGITDGKIKKNKTEKEIHIVHEEVEKFEELPQIPKPTLKKKTVPVKQTTAIVNLKSQDIEELPVSERRKVARETPSFLVEPTFVPTPPHIDVPVALPKTSELADKEEDFTIPAFTPIQAIDIPDFYDDTPKTFEMAEEFVIPTFTPIQDIDIPDFSDDTPKTYETAADIVIPTFTPIPDIDIPDFSDNTPKTADIVIPTEEIPVAERRKIPREMPLFQTEPVFVPTPPHIDIPEAAEVVIPTFNVDAIKPEFSAKIPGEMGKLTTDSLNDVPEIFIPN